MSYVHSHPYYWDNVVNFGDFGLWISITASNLQQWANWHFGGNNSNIGPQPHPSEPVCAQWALLK